MVNSDKSLILTTALVSGAFSPDELDQLWAVQNNPDVQSIPCPVKFRGGRSEATFVAQELMPSRAEVVGGMPLEIWLLAGQYNTGVLKSGAHGKTPVQQWAYWSGSRRAAKNKCDREARQAKKAASGAASASSTTTTPAPVAPVVAAPAAASPTLVAPVFVDSGFDNEGVDLKAMADMPWHPAFDLLLSQSPTTEDAVQELPGPEDQMQEAPSPEAPSTEVLLTEDLVPMDADVGANAGRLAWYPEFEMPAEWCNLFGVQLR